MNEISYLLLLPFEISLFLSLVLAILTLSSYSRTGPKLKDVIESDFQLFAILTFIRLSAWSLGIIFFISAPGAIAIYAISKYYSIKLLTHTTVVISSLIYITFISGYFFCYQLLYIPASLQISCRFRFSRIIPLWKKLTPFRVGLFKLTIINITFLIFTTALFFAYAEQNIFLELYLSCLALFYTLIVLWNDTKLSSIPIGQVNSNNYNIIMIGTDTLRIDRLGKYGYSRQLTPNIDNLCGNSILFSNCITPLARTAPSLASFLSGLWPHNHEIRDNYPGDKSCAHFPNKNLVKILNNHGYATSVISDWAGADYKKINFGFQQFSLPEDQWNLKQLIKQGSSYLRLFLSLFTHNKFGKYILPELYYLAGKPLTSHLGRDCRNTISELAKKDQRFFINLFTSTTHVPFGSEYPYYNLFTPKDYKGDSRFIMADLSTPEQIVESQKSTSEHHDLSQIINLYDSCVKEFDDEVGKIVDHIDKCGLRDNTYIVIYSDHGTDFFETECWGQGNTLVGDDPSGRIPLIISGPGLPKNTTFKHVCRSIDFMPTMLDILGMEIPKNIDGVSLLPYIKENNNPNLYAFQETGIWMGKIPGQHPDQITYPDIIELLTIPDIKAGTLVIDEKYYPTVLEAKNRSIQDDRWKLIYIPTYHGPVYQLYDLKTDPYRDVTESYPEIVAELKPKLDDWIFNQPKK